MERGTWAARSNDSPTASSNTCRRFLGPATATASAQTPRLRVRLSLSTCAKAQRVLTRTARTGSASSMWRARAFTSQHWKRHTSPPPTRCFVARNHLFTLCRSAKASKSIAVRAAAATSIFCVSIFRIVDYFSRLPARIYTTSPRQFPLLPHERN